MDTTHMSLQDLMYTPQFDLFERAEKVKEYCDDFRHKKHMQYERVALNGSGPIRKVLCHYDGKVKDMIYLASNDYLNLTMHPKVIQAAKDALDEFGAGAGSVPLLGGTTILHEKLTKRLAEFKGCEDTIVYTSGYGSNLGSLLAMLQKDDVAILDTLVHASLYDGCANTNKEFFLHNNMNSLEHVLKQCKNKYRTKLIIVDGVYSMDGDIAHLDKIVELAKHYGAYTMIDEAHATGVIGKNGRGTPEHFDLEGKIDIVAGTLSKGVGAVGGFVSSNKALIELLTFYSRSYMFSTALPPSVAASILASLDVIESEPQIRENLWNNISYFKKGLLDFGFNIGNSETAIFPVIVGNDFKVREMCKDLHEMNIYVNPVLYPAVKKRSARIRMSLMSTHTKEHLDTTLNALEHLGKKYNII